jgi:hypothetical protein
MKAKLLIGETATVHSDNTISVLRAGITHVWGEKPPYNLEGVLIVRIEGGLPDEGSHQFDLRCLGEDGQPVGGQIQGQFDVPRGGGITNLVLKLVFGFPKKGRYNFYIRVDNVELDSYWVVAGEKPQGLQ